MSITRQLSTCILCVGLSGAANADVIPVSRSSVQSLYSWQHRIVAPRMEFWDLWDWSGGTSDLLPYSEANGGVSQSSAISSIGCAVDLSASSGASYSSGLDEGWSSSTSFAYAFQVDSYSKYSIVGHSSWNGPAEVTLRLTDLTGNIVWAMSETGNFDANGSLVPGQYTLTAAVVSGNSSAISAGQLQVNMSIVPAPGSLALLGAMGLRSARRRR